MVQAFDRLVSHRAVLAVVPFLALAGCQCLWPRAPAQEAGAETVAGIETAATPACPDITKAEAWVNRMPSIGDTPARLVVVLGVASDAPWMLAPTDATASGTLTLDLKPGGNSVAGTVAYRQPQPSPLPDTIQIMCHGSEMARIDEILIVQ